MEPMGRKKRSNPPSVELENVATATDCTGLIPASVKTEDQAEAYAKLRMVLPIKPAGQ